MCEWKCEWMSAYVCVYVRMIVRVCVHTVWPLNAKTLGIFSRAWTYLAARAHLQAASKVDRLLAGKWRRHLSLLLQLVWIWHGLHRGTAGLRVLFWVVIFSLLILLFLQLDKWRWTTRLCYVNLAPAAASFSFCFSLAFIRLFVWMSVWRSHVLYFISSSLRPFFFSLILTSFATSPE